MIDPVRGSLDDAGQPFAQRHQTNDEFRRVAKSRVEKTANARTRSALPVVRSHVPSSRPTARSRSPRRDEEQGIIPPRRHVSKRDRDRHGEQQQIERRKRPTGFSRARHASIGAWPAPSLKQLSSLHWRLRICAVRAKSRA